MSKICFDKTRPFSENRGDCTPDDPHYRVRRWQGGMLGKDMVLLPFDEQGELVPDDGKIAPWTGMNSDGKPVTHFPLWNPKMREYLARKEKRSDAIEAQAQSSAEAEDEDFSTSTASAVDEVNFVSYLKGEKRYEPHLLRAAIKKRYSLNIPRISDIVRHLVIDEKVLPEADVHDSISRYLDDKVAAA